ncbi:hypothetical protein T11_9388 [Trichinella zimbabwensis]|uniref:Uncharacterized protein n=1 Tax=Trichinella zimbabwensis TaxID=268475 RepID=A0A0V1H1K3_9BILA|nr:hypothetical protein T11_9388 [Trichinella zimbabwensis]
MKKLTTVSKNINDIIVGNSCVIVVVSSDFIIIAVFYNIIYYGFVKLTNEKGLPVLNVIFVRDDEGQSNMQSIKKCKIKLKFLNR